MWRVLGNILSNHDPKVKVKSEEAGIWDGVPSTSLVSYVLMASHNEEYE